MLYHTVLYQVHDDTEPEAIEKALEAMRGLGAIPAVRSVVAGRNTMPVTDGWSYGMTLVFDDQRSMMEQFAPHPLHDAIMRDHIPLFKRYMAMDVNSDPNERGLRGDD